MNLRAFINVIRGQELLRTTVWGKIFEYYVKPTASSCHYTKLKTFPVLQESFLLLLILVEFGCSFPPVGVYFKSVEGTLVFALYLHWKFI